MDIDKEYEGLKEDYGDFLGEVTTLVSKLLIKSQVPTAMNVYGRIKTLKSIKEKITSERASIKESITELDDLVGFRIVLLFPEYKEQCLALLADKFDHHVKPDPRQQHYDKFGYNSIHAILTIKKEWAHAPNWSSHSEKKIEVQIRTLSEHAWAETSHALFYKREENIPNALLRDLNKVSALLEIVDSNLQSIKDRVVEHFDHIANCPYEEILTLDLYAETFRRVMTKNSNGIYDLDDYENRELSSKVEKEFNKLTTATLEEVIADKIDLTNLTSKEYVNQFLVILEEDKAQILSVHNVPKE